MSGGAVRGIFGESHGFQMILVFGNIIYKGRTVDNRLQMMEGGEVFIYYGALGD